MKRLDFINRRLREKNQAREYINNFDVAMLEYYRVFAKQIKHLPPEPQKIVNYYLLQWAQAWQHMPYTGNLYK